MYVNKRIAENMKMWLLSPEPEVQQHFPLLFVFQVGVLLNNYVK